MEQAHGNAYEKEIEQMLIAANNVIARQKDAVTRAEAGTSWKERIASLEADHIAERT